MSKNLFKDVYRYQYDTNTRMKLYDSTKNSRSLLQRMGLLQRLPVHSGCVNSICWTETGTHILSGSDDKHLVITDAFQSKVTTRIRTRHGANIFCAKFLPATADRKIISCSGNGVIIYTDLDTYVEATPSNLFNCHGHTVYEIATIPNDPNTFFSCAEDGTVRWFDLRIKQSCKKKCTESLIINCRRALTSIVINPVATNQLAVGCSDSCGRVYDLRMVATKGSSASNTVQPQAQIYRLIVPEHTSDADLRITSLVYSPDGTNILASFSSDFLYLFSLQPGVEAEPVIACNTASGTSESSEPKVARTKKLRLRGDWSDTGPNSGPNQSLSSGGLSVLTGETAADLASNPEMPFRGAASSIGPIIEPITRSSAHFHSALMTMTNTITRMIINNSSITSTDVNTGASSSLSVNEAMDSSLLQDRPSTSTDYRCYHTGGIGATDMDEEEADPLPSKGSLKIARKCEFPPLYDPVVIKKYDGHRNARTMIKEAAFWGTDFVASGSDCGHVFFWDRNSTELVMLLEADRHVVNCIQPNPTLPILATSGIDYDVKLWAPNGEDCAFNSSVAEEICSQNKIMLEETRDTVTVPASFIVRMVTLLNQYRQGHPVTSEPIEPRSREDPSSNA